MRSTYKALIVVAALAVAGRARAQEPGARVEVSPTPVAAQPAPDTAQAAPAVPNPEAIAPAELAPLPTSTTTAPEVQAAPAAPAPETIAPAQKQPATVAPAVPSKTVKARTPRETTTKEPMARESAPETTDATAAAAAATAGADQTPPSNGAGPDAVVPPAPVTDQNPVVEPVTTEARAPRTSSTLLLVGGLLVGVGGIGAMLARRRRNDTVSIVDHDAPVASTRPPLAAAHQRSRPTTQGLS